MGITIKQLTINNFIALAARVPQKLHYLYLLRFLKFYAKQLLTEEQKEAFPVKVASMAHIESIQSANSIKSSRGINHYQEEIILKGRFESLCPKCGKICYSEKSYPVFISDFDLPIFYRFNCCYEFYLIAAKSPARILGIYIPRHKIVVSFEDYLSAPHNRYYYGLKSFSIWISELQRLRRAYEKSSNPLKKGIAKPIVLTGFLGNFGHHLPDEIGGLSQLTTSEIKRLKIVVGPRDWFSLKNIFTSIEDYDVIPKSDIRLADQVFAYVEEKGEACVTRLTSDQPLSADISKRLTEISTQGLDEDKTRLLTVLEGSPLIWVTLRSHIRCWDGQAEGLAEAINMLAKHYPKLGIVFDGFWGEVSSYQIIKANIDPTIKTFSALGFNLSDSIPFVNKCDFFIAPLGAGVAITSIPNISGVLHTHSEWAKRGKWVVPSPREDGVQCMLIGGDITSGTDMFYYNYEISVQELFEGSLQIAESLGFQSNLKSQPDQ